MVDSISFRNDQSGVSPVIGVILMVAVTVIIAAVIGSSALGVADEVSETPPTSQISVETEQDTTMPTGPNQESYSQQSVNTFTISHGGGEEIDMENVEVRINGEPADNVYSASTEVPSVKDDNWPDYPKVTDPLGYKSSLSAGDEITLYVQTDVIANLGAATDPSTSNENWLLAYRESHFNGNNLVTYDGGDWHDHPSNNKEMLFDQGDTMTVVWSSGDSSQVLAEGEI